MSAGNSKDEFTAWLLAVDVRRDRQGLMPITKHEANLMEQAWQASRATLVVDLPEAYQNHLDGDVFDAYDVREAIESAGITCK